MNNTAVLWIRDGVLIDRMPVNAAAFAVASLAFADAAVAGRTDLTMLVDFAFATSGISCRDKMLKFNDEELPLIADVEMAADYYNKLSATAAVNCFYIEGIDDVLRKLDQQGVLNFITSAVEQRVLDEWAETAQATPVVPHLTEILGKRGDGFTKGRDHFQHVCSKYAVKRILYVADALSEIGTAARFASEFNIVAIGFAHVITDRAVESALKLVLETHNQLSRSSCTSFGSLDSGKLRLPDESELVAALKGAGAFEVVSGCASDIARELDRCLAETLRSAAR